MKRRLLHLDVTSLGEQIAPSMRKPVCVKSKISEPWSGDSVEPLQRAPESRANHTSYFLRRRAGRIKNVYGRLADHPGAISKRCGCYSRLTDAICSSTLISTLKITSTGMAICL